MITAVKSQRDYQINELERPSIVIGAKTQLEKDGYWVFSAGNTERSTVLELADCFGKCQGHVQSDKEGVRKVTSKSSSQKSGKQQYTANSNTEILPHTDGRFMA